MNIGAAAMWTSAWVVLCACAALAAKDAKRQCSCSGVLRRTADCSQRGRSSFGNSDLCTGRTTKVDLSHNKFRVFPHVLGAYVTHVNISHNHLTALPRSPPLTAKTHSLDLSFNQIKRSGTELRPLSALHVLDVSHNRLSSLQFLPDPCALRRLSAQANSLQEFPIEIDRCKHLKSLDLSGNALVVLPADAFSALVNLEHVRLQDADLQQLEAACFKGLGRLKHLDLTNNKLPALFPDVFTPLQKLKELYLDSNSITDILEDAFEGLSKLELLSLTKNLITQLHPYEFSPLDNLKSLLLNENELKRLPLNAFSGLLNIQNIMLSGNRLETLPAQLFAGLRTLRNVSLASNYLKELPTDMLEGVDHLHLLDLHYNQLSALPEGLFRDVRFLQVLDLSHNFLATFDGRALAGLKRLDLLDLQYNDLVAVPAFDLSWPSLGRALVGDNRIEEVTEAQLRAWLGSGHLRRALALGPRPPLRSLDQLRWALYDRKVLAAARDRCECGFLKQRYAEVSFCTAAKCPGAVDDWMEAVRATETAAAQG